MRITNNYLMPGQVRRLDALGLLSHIRVEGATFTLEHRDGYQRLYFSSEGEIPDLPDLSHILTTYLTFREAVDSAAESWLYRQGFKLAHSLIRMSAQQQPLRRVIGEAVRAEESEALKLFASAFEPIEIDLPKSGHGLMESLFAVRDSSGAPMGVLYADGKTLAALAVEPEARGQGIAQSLIAAYVSGAESLPGDYRVWVVDSNSPAIRLYSRVGFAPDGLRSNLYVLR
ncbi:MAG: GNAT family N-acetyltransferase [Oscillospiraceae bacterium]|jgi:ribosomal protein S18 acetylase RimI-like enzyme|nr:GNAT family N-acetyltransferase [Oscillospiraceae bacterium]